jgi:hypothetical protein
VVSSLRGCYRRSEQQSLSPVGTCWAPSSRWYFSGRRSRYWYSIPGTLPVSYPLSVSAAAPFYKYTTAVEIATSCLRRCLCVRANWIGGQDRGPSICMTSRSIRHRRSIALEPASTNTTAHRQSTANEVENGAQADQNRLAKLIDEENTSSLTNSGRRNLHECF